MVTLESLFHVTSHAKISFVLLLYSACLVTFTYLSSVASWACGEGLVAVLVVLLVQPAIDNEVTISKRTAIAAIGFDCIRLLKGDSWLNNSYSVIHTFCVNS